MSDFALTSGWTASDSEDREERGKGLTANSTAAEGDGSAAGPQEWLPKQHYVTRGQDIVAPTEIRPYRSDCTGYRTADTESETLTTVKQLEALNVF